MQSPSSLFILTGAGISAESGMETFRDRRGIWSRVDHNEVATPQGFARNPAKVYDFYNERRRNLRDVYPNEAHHALARLEAGFKGRFLLVTQNVDDLHESAGSRKLVHMHGELRSALCQGCGKRCRWGGDMDIDSECPHCGLRGRMRPDIVWFGEFPYHMDEIHAALATADLFVAIGTSGSVYPAAAFVKEARMNGARTLELNLEPSDLIGDFDDAVHGKASEIVPAFVDRLLAGAPI
ncbi:MAG: NAD-dependent deacylase [Rhizobiaceae bacterium]|nr:MAG: NAD-dependent deacylase [Rhizobiaceae bacterium]